MNKNFLIYKKNKKSDQVTKIYELRITKKCNQNCIFCNSTKHMDNYIENKNEIKSKIIKISRQGYNVLIFTGREPTLNINLPEYIRFAKKNKIKHIGIQTNALRCSYNLFVKKLKKSGLTDALASIHSHIPNIYEKLTDTPGSFEIAKRGIKNLIKNDIRMKLNIVINKYNFESLKDICENILTEFTGIKSILFSSLAFSGEAEDNKTLFIKYSSIIPYLKDAMNYLIKNKIDFNLLDRCGIPMCLLKNYEKFHDSYNKYSETEVNCLTTDREKKDSCKFCYWNFKCSGYWKKYKELFGDKEFNPVRK